jgi:hypothetical protein
MVDSRAVRSFQPEMEENAEYRSIDPAALLGLALGLVSAAAMAETVLWLIPPAGILVSVIALRRIRQDPTRIGRAVALLGLGLSVFFGTAPLAQMLTTHELLSRQARPVADQWFEYLRQRHPEKALWLQSTPDARPALDEDGWFFYRHDKDGKARLTKFVAIPLVRALLELGPDAQVRFYKATESRNEWSHGQVDCWYTVTFTDTEGRKKTFLVGLLMERSPTRREGISPWHIRDAVGGANPSAI